MSDLDKQMQEASGTNLEDTPVTEVSLEQLTLKVIQLETALEASNEQTARVTQLLSQSMVMMAAEIKALKAGSNHFMVTPSDIVLVNQDNHSEIEASQYFLLATGDDNFLLFENTPGSKEKPVPIDREDIQASAPVAISRAGHEIVKGSFFYFNIKG